MKRLKHLKNFLSTVIVFSVLVMTFNLSTTNNLINSLSEPKSNYHANLHNWLYGDLIGVALSSLKSDLKGYVGYDLIKETLTTGNLSNVALQKASNIENIANTSIYNIAQLDLGFVDYARASFLIFGLNTEGFTHFYFLLLFISVSLYLVYFINNNIAIFYLILFLYSHYIVVAALSVIGPQLEAVYNYRFISVLAILPAMHILTAIIANKIMNTYSLLLVLFQSLIIIFIIWIRSSALWFSIYLFAFVILTSVIIYSKQKYNNKNGIELIKFKMRKINKKIWPIYTVFILLLLLKTIQPLFLNPVYFDSKDAQAGHYKWHSIYLGMALHPEISNVYSDNDLVAEAQNYFSHACNPNRVSYNSVNNTLKKWICDHRIELEPLLRWGYYVLRHTDDQDGYSAAFKYLTDRGDSELDLFRFNPEDKVDYHSAFSWFNKHNAPSEVVSQDDPERRLYHPYRDIRLKKYESILKSVTFDVLANYPFQVIETLLIIKPAKLFYHYVSNYFLIRNLPPAILTLFILIYLIFLLRQSSTEDIKIFYRTMLFFSLFSLMIPIAIYPAYYAISEVALLFNLCIIASVLIIVNYLLTLMSIKYIKNL
jgi:hypothetical protein